MTPKEQAESLIGREIEVEKTRDGKYIVLFMALGESPPPKGATPEEAVEKFAEWIKSRPARELPDPEEDVDGRNEGAGLSED